MAENNNDNHNQNDDLNHLLLAIPVNIQTGKLSEIERQLGWSLWGWLAEQFIESLYTEVNA